MEPLLSLIEKKQLPLDDKGSLNPGDDLTSIDRINKSLLLCQEIYLATSTKETRVRHETTDDD